MRIYSCIKHDKRITSIGCPGRDPKAFCLLVGVFFYVLYRWHTLYIISISVYCTRISWLMGHRGRLCPYPCEFVGDVFWFLILWLVGLIESAGRNVKYSDCRLDIPWLRFGKSHFALWWSPYHVSISSIFFVYFIVQKEKKKTWAAQHHQPVEVD